MRIGTANNYDNALEQLFKRQSELASQQEKVGSAKRVNRASDDPGAAATAERAMTRISRIETDQRALETQRSALATAESALGDSTALLQSARDFVLAAGNGSYSALDRATLATQITSMRDQLFMLANGTDGNGVPLFGGLASARPPFLDVPAGVQFQGVGGQRSATETALPGAMDGQAIWMNVSRGNGTFQVALAPANSGAAWTDAGTVTTPGALTGDNYTLTFSVVAGVTSYNVVDTTTATTVLSAQPYVDGAPVQFDGMSVVVHGQPQNGDAITVAPSTKGSVFDVLDDAIKGIDNAQGDNKLAQAVALALVEFDSSLERINAARSQAGEWLVRADTITSAQEARSISAEADKSRAVDLDMARGISDLNQAQTGYQAALQSYAQIQRLTLFNFIN
jgi:flagellar hook-associated protein 3 FlgL